MMKLLLLLNRMTYLRQFFLKFLGLESTLNFSLEPVEANLDLCLTPI